MTALAPSLRTSVGHLVRSRRCTLQTTTLRRRHQSTALYYNDRSTAWILAAASVGMHYCGHAMAQQPRSACEAAALIPPHTDDDNTTAVTTTTVRPWAESTVREKIRRTWRFVRRLVQLALTLSPVVACYPLIWLLTANDNNRVEQRLSSSTDADSDAHSVMLNDTSSNADGIAGWYLTLCLACVERSGAAVIKLMQWAGSRPDLFGHEFCRVFSKLQDNTTPHAWKHTEQLLRESLGEDWRDRVELGEILGSGCIGQVYRGSVVVPQKGGGGDAAAMGQQQERQDVAVKILHPSVHDDIDADLDIMRATVRAAKYLPFDVFRNMKWLNMEGVVEEFARLLMLQIDMRNEAANLERFNENFKDNDAIEFPRLVPGFAPTQRVLVETFCEGVPVVKFCRENQDRQDVLTSMCRNAITAVCQMIFLDNFVHGDLHPGNVFISADGKKFILFDVGIVNEYEDDDHNLIIDVLAAFIRKNGRLAGRRMIDDSNSKLRGVGTGDSALEEDKYLDKIELLTIRASTKGYLMENLGNYITYICEAASTHHVMINPAFVSASLAVKIQEGLALAMDPACKIPKIAIPIIVESERRRVVKAASSSMGLDRLKDFIFGSNERSAA